MMTIGTAHLAFPSLQHPLEIALRPVLAAAAALLRRHLLAMAGSVHLMMIIGIVLRESLSLPLLQEALRLAPAASSQRLRLRAVRASAHPMMTTGTARPAYQSLLILPAATPRPARAASRRPHCPLPTVMGTARLMMITGTAHREFLSPPSLLAEAR
jgi:hypothetical protein